MAIEFTPTGGRERGKDQDIYGPGESNVLSTDFAWISRSFNV
jgi:hypothetical protein